MGFRLGKGSLRRLEQAHPSLAEVIEGAIGITSVDFTVHEVARDYDTQKRYFDQGLTRTMNSRHMVDPETGYSYAADIVPYINGRLVWQGTDGRAHPAFKEIARAMWTSRMRTGLILRHGADFNFTGKQDGSLIDWPHWEMPEDKYWPAAIGAIQVYYSHFKE